MNYYVLINKLLEFMGELELFPLLLETASNVSLQFWVNQLDCALKSSSVNCKTLRCTVNIIYRFGLSFNAQSMAQFHKRG